MFALKLPWLSQDQAGFMPGRDLTENTHKALHVVQYVQHLKEQAILLSLDVQKAFDSLEISFLETVLIHMGIGNKFLSAISVIYANPQVKLKFNNMYSDKLYLGRGTCKGCPLSPVFFAIVKEPLANAIRNNHNIQGMKINQKENKLMLFEDDILLLPYQMVLYSQEAFLL